MAVLKEWTCRAHGDFEAFADRDEVPECPKGCSSRWVKREIRTAPASREVTTGRMDTLQRSVADDFGLSNLKVDKENGQSVVQNLRSTQDFSPKWTGMPRSPAPGWSARGEKPPTVNVGAAFGMQSDNALSRVKMLKPTPAFVGRPKD